MPGAGWEVSGKTSIEWTNRTWNPTRGCSMAAGSNSPIDGGCYNCYAARQALRHAGPGGAYEGLVHLTEHGPRWTGKVPLIESSLDAPSHVKEPCMWFVNSMSDLFHESLEFATIARIVRVMMEANWHTYQVLTKRAKRLREFSEWWYMQTTDPLPRHIWFGVSVETQPKANEQLPELLRAQLTGVRWASYEPALGPVDWANIVSGGIGRHALHVERSSSFQNEQHLDWIVVGGESGPGARPFDLAWAKRTIDQCREAGVPCFVKQLGRVVLGADLMGKGEPAGAIVRLKDRKGGDMFEWPEWARVREWPK